MYIEARVGVNRGLTHSFDAKTLQYHQVERGSFKIQSQLQAKVTSLQQELASLRAQARFILWFSFPNSLFVRILEELRWTSQHNVALREENLEEYRQLYVSTYCPILWRYWRVAGFIEKLPRVPSCRRTPMSRNPQREEKMAGCILPRASDKAQGFDDKNNQNAKQEVTEISSRYLKPHTVRLVQI